MKNFTEPPFTGIYVNHHEPGMYKCITCGQDLFSSQAKFDSGTGWPSFWDSVDKTKVKLHEDLIHGMTRTEVTCSNCGAHLGHLFDDGPEDKGGMRYCINSCTLNFEAK